MIRLNLTAAPAWLELAPGLRLKLAPLTTALMVAARSDLALTAITDTTSANEMAMLMAKAIGRRAVLDWEGVGDAAGNLVAVSSEGIDALLDIWPVFEAFQEHYVAGGLLLDAEKNVSALSPNGPLAGATGTARPAKGRARSARKN